MSVRISSALRVLLVAAVTAIFGAATAQPRDLLRQGEFAAAYREAEAREDAQSKVLAAQAAAYQALYLANDAVERRLWLDRAAEAAGRAIALAPESAQAHFELARAEGILVQSRGVLQNLDAAPRLRRLFDRTLELDPEHAEAMVALAQWHLELAENGVAWIYGGDRRRVVPLFERALELAPERIGLRVEYASALERLSRPDEATRQLDLALALPAPSAVDGFEQARARRLLHEFRAASR